MKLQSMQEMCIHVTYKTRIMSFMLPALRPSAWVFWRLVRWGRNARETFSWSWSDLNRSQVSATGTSNTDFNKTNLTHPKGHFTPFPPPTFPLAAAPRTVGRLPQISPHTMPYEIAPYHLVKPRMRLISSASLFTTTNTTPKAVRILG